MVPSRSDKKTPLNHFLFFVLTSFTPNLLLSLRMSYCPLIRPKSFGFLVLFPLNNFPNKNVILKSLHIYKGLLLKYQQCQGILSGIHFKIFSSKYLIFILYDNV